MIKPGIFQVLIILLYLFEFGIATVGAVSTEKENAKTAYDFYLSGNHLYHAGKYDEAIRAFEQCVRIEPSYYFAYVNLGVAQAKKREFRQAVQQFTFCIDEQWGSEEDRFVFYFNRALAGKEGGLTQTVQKDWTAIQELDPVRARECQNSRDYIFMDALYSQRMNEADKNRLFQKHKASIAKGKIVVRKIPGHKDNAEEYEAIGLIEGTLEEVTGVLADYQNYPEFMPTVKQVSIRNSSGEGLDADHTLGLPMGINKKYRLRYWAKHEGNKIQLFWKKMPWPELKPKETVVDTWGQWILEDYSEADHYVLAYYRVYTDPGSIPLGFGWIAEIVTRDSIPNVIEQTRRRVKQIAESAKH